MAYFTADEAEIVAFLKCYRGQYLSAREVCRRAGNKRKYQENPRWAMPLLVSLLVRGYVEADGGGHYRLIEKEDKPADQSSVPAAGPSSGDQPDATTIELEMPEAGALDLLKPRT